MKRKHLSWEQVGLDISVLVSKLVGQEFGAILGVARGGLVPAAVIANALNIRVVDTAPVTSYRAPGRRERLQLLLPLRPLPEPVLVVDDLVDSGTTVRFLRSLLPASTKVAVVYVKPIGQSATDFFAIPVPQSTWLCFPWE